MKKQLCLKNKRVVFVFHFVKVLKVSDEEAVFGR